MCLLFTASLASAKRNNPFALPAGVDFVDNIEPVVEAEPVDLHLEGVILGQKKVAIINNRNYLQGQQVHGRRVLEIHKDHVLIEGEKRNIELWLDRKPFTVRVTHPVSRQTSP